MVATAALVRVQQTRICTVKSRDVPGPAHDPLSFSSQNSINIININININMYAYRYRVVLDKYARMHGVLTDALRRPAPLCRM